MMTRFARHIDALDWPEISGQLDMEGHAVLTGLFTADVAGELMRRAEDGSVSQRTDLFSAEPGGGDPLFFGPALPEPLEDLRQALYP